MYPKNYNFIESMNDNWILWKNQDLPSTGIVPFKGIDIDFGSDNGIVKIKRIIYPKSEFAITDIQKIAENTINCPYCIEGKIPNTSYLEKYTEKKKGFLYQSSNISNISDFNMTFTQKVGSFVRMNNDQSTTYISQLFAELFNLPIDWFSTVLGAKVLKLLIGGIGIFNIERNKKISPQKKAELRIFFSNLFFRALDPSPEVASALAADIDKLKSGLKFGNKGNLMSAFINPSNKMGTAFQNMLGSFNLPRFSFPKFGSFNIPQVAPSPIKDLDTVEQLKYSSPKLSGLFNFVDN